MCIEPLLSLPSAPDFDALLYEPLYHKRRFVFPTAQSIEHEHQQNVELLCHGSSLDLNDLACGEQIPETVLRAVADESVTKWAFNASFERVCLSAWLRRHRPDLFRGYGVPNDSVGGYLDPASWRCSLVWSAYLGLPLSLEGAGAVLRLQDQKMSEGRALIRYFSMPCKPTRTNGGRTWNLPRHAPDKWAVYKAYNKRDVEVEMAIQAKLAAFPVPDPVWD
ncbi:MAG: hypothetical protein IK133_01635, partial [Clostridia bacterium]|nr:hypothetical protein [Clostridia bacterium]